MSLENSLHSTKCIYIILSFFKERTHSMMTNINCVHVYKVYQKQAQVYNKLWLYMISLSPELAYLHAQTQIEIKIDITHGENVLV